jgi:hypothetical protein
MTAACGGDDSNATPDATPDAATVDYNVPVFDMLPQFGIYTSADPTDYTPPAGVTMWAHGTVFVTKLTPDMQAMIGADVAAQITYIAQCDNYDRLGGLFFLEEPVGQAPQETDPRVELVRWITPFSDYTRSHKTLAYPDADISAFAGTIASADHDIWIGVQGGSNPYDQDPCAGTSMPDSFKEVGFLYSVNLASKHVLGNGASLTLSAVDNPNVTTVPIDGTLVNPGDQIAGHVNVIVSGHGPGQGGDEYEHTMDTVLLDGTSIGTFDTMIDCAPFAASSPDGNPGIFQGNTTTNPRNWCPGAIVPIHTFPAALPAGSHTVELQIDPDQVPDGSYYDTSISFGAP